MTAEHLYSPEDLSSHELASLKLIAGLAPLRNDHVWVIFGSMAARLIGAKVSPADIDVLGARDAIHRCLAHLGLPPTSGDGGGMFRSELFGRVELADGLPVEFMSGTTLTQENRLLKFATRLPVNGPFGQVFIPSLKEQIAILHRFGRPKDLDRAKILQSML